MLAIVEPLVTVADLEALPDDGNRYELVGGEILVSRAPAIPHQRIIHNLQFLIESYLRQNPIGILIPGSGIVFGNYDSSIPDLMFIRQERVAEIASGDKVTGAPDLIVEVMSLSEQDRFRDLVIKRQLYARYGVPEYWVIDRDNDEIRIYRLEDNILEKIGTFIGEVELKTPILPDFSFQAFKVFLI
jgi:Uma2 family endonuclease